MSNMTTAAKPKTPQESEFWPIVGFTFVCLWNIVRFMPRTLSWLALVLLVHDVVLLSVLGLVLMVGVCWARRVPPVAWLFQISPAQDWLSSRARRRNIRASKAGSVVLEQIGLGGLASEGRLYEEGNVRRLAMRTLSGRVGLSEVTAAADRGTAYMRCETVAVEETTPGEYQIRWFKVAPADPLGQARPLTAARSVESVNRVPYGVDEQGEIVYFDYSGKAGGVVSGVPGSGKSAAITSMLASMASLPEVQMLIIDGKAGTDFEFMESRAEWHHTDDFAATIEALERVTAVMRERVATLKSVTGSSNLWHTGPDAERFPLLLVVVDECQTFFDSRGMSKEKKAQAESITALVQTLIKVGRSAGIFTWCLTQKSTTDSLPSGIRDQAAVRWACRVMTSEAEVAVLGNRGMPSPVDLSAALPGSAIVQAEDGSRRRVRFDYLSENLAEQAVLASAHLRRPIGPTATGIE